ncbi:MAG: thioredoxin [Muribaculaceae bacterium]|nr:thioredoxin [Muribaculaceae bacterium]
MKKSKILLKIAASAVLVLLASCGGKTVTDDTATETAAETVVADNATVAAGMPQVIDFNATWCGPCRMFAPTFEKMEKKYEGKITFQSVDVDENPDMAAQYEVQSIPTVVYIDAEGKTVDVTVGLLSEEEFDARLQKLL